MAVFTLLVAVPAIGISGYPLDASYNDNKPALIREQQAKATALAGRMDQMRVDVSDRVRSIHVVGLSKADRELVPSSTRHCALAPLTAFYVNAKGVMTASIGAQGHGSVAAVKARALIRPTSVRGSRHAQRNVYIRPTVQGRVPTRRSWVGCVKVREPRLRRRRRRFGEHAFREGPSLPNARIGRKATPTAVASSGRAAAYPSLLAQAGVTSIGDHESDPGSQQVKKAVDILGGDGLDDRARLWTRTTGS